MENTTIIVVLFLCAVPGAALARFPLVARLLAYERLRRVADCQRGTHCGEPGLRIRGRQWERGHLPIEIPRDRPRIPKLRLADIRAAASRVGAGRTE